MAPRPLRAAVDELRRSALREAGAGVTDGELLEHFLRRRDEAAFEALLRRHGPMVLGVCRRVLGNAHDAEDAFQATFLVLVRKAASVRPRGLVGNWLYGVAHNTARKARAMTTKQRLKERQAPAPPEAPPPDDGREELLAALDRELQALPDRYRAALVLCELQGKSIKEAALLTGCPAATLSTRLARGRRLLARRLAGRGVTFSGGALAAALSGEAAGVPPLLFNSTLQAAATGLSSAKAALLAEGVVKAMLLTKLKVATALLLTAAVVGSGAGTLAHKVTAARPAAPAEVVARRAPAPPVPSDEDLKTLLQKVRKAHGTPKRLLKTKALRLKVEGTIVGGKQKGPFTLVETWRLPDHYRMEMTTTEKGVKKTSVGAVSKDKGWLMYPGWREDLDKETAAFLLDAPYTRPYGVVPLLHDKGHAVSYVGRTKLGGKPAFCLQVQSKGRPDLKLYFDKASGLLARAQYTVKILGEKKVSEYEVFFSDYREKDGYKYPRKVVLYVDTEKRVEAEVTAVEILPELDDKVFTKP